jgi:hypothetical protein
MLIHLADKFDVMFNLFVMNDRGRSLVRLAETVDFYLNLNLPRLKRARQSTTQVEAESNVEHHHDHTCSSHRVEDVYKQYRVVLFY